MHYSQYKKRFPDDVLVYIEEFNKQDGTVLFDFIDSNEYAFFSIILGLNPNLSNPSMVLLENYKGRTIQDNTIYAIKRETVQSWESQINVNLENLNSYLIGYNIKVSETVAPIFDEPVSLNDFDDVFNLNYYMHGKKGELEENLFPKVGKISVTIRNVGQGNWNEISFSDEVKVVYDAGAPMNASKAQVAKIIGNRNSIYSTSKPILILSHWDKDHYHSLLGMSEVELSNNFSAFICRDHVPNLTSRILFSRIREAIGVENIYAISADARSTRGPTIFRPITPTDNRIVIYNSRQHKDRNISGLLLVVKTIYNSIILPGDAHYDQISRDVLPYLNYKHHHNLVVPHHGGKAGTYKYNTPASVSLDQAIISVGANRYGHPFVRYKDALIASGFVTRQTNTIGDITIPL